MAPDMTTKRVARCGIYENRPQVCKDYPKVDHYLPEECTYTFNGSERRGECTCDVGACCNTPREGGEPGGAAMPSIAGGKSCKHLVWSEVPTEKVAAVSMGASVPFQGCSLCDLVGGPRDT